MLIFALAAAALAGCGLTAVTSFVRGNTDTAYDPTGETLWLAGVGYELSTMAADDIARYKASQKGKFKEFNAKVVSKLVKFDSEGKHYVIVVEIKDKLYYCRTDQETYGQTRVGTTRKVVIVT